MTRVMMLQHRVSRMRSAWVQKSIRGSNISGELSTKCRIDSEFGATAATRGSPGGGSSGSIWVSVYQSVICFGTYHLAVDRAGWQP